MQLRHALTTVLYALCCAESVVGRETALRKRQDNTDVATTPPPDSTPQSSGVSTTEPPPSSTADPSPTSDGSTQDPSSRTEDSSSTVSLTTSTTQDATSTKAHGAAKATETGKKKKQEEDQLPIHPIITPAIGLAGVILMGTGVAFCLIGIKHQWLHVYLSAAYSTSLGVTVLIVYVMDPPVSDAIQGAYFVAAVITGLIFGALSLVFKEVTEGLGCLIGGFCLAMWFLVLRPGGLIQTESGRAIMIGVFSVVGLSLSFSQYTRNYGLIGCTAFAGAMITVLGIDCFSRAGLKEFWLYLWSLNKDIFPIGTDTYPITRGIRVEIAVTVIIFLFGVMSQLKIWKIVKERREKKEAQQLAEDEHRDQLAGEVGQDVEALNQRQLAQWEAVYGDGSKAKLHHDSGIGTSVGSTHKKSTSVTTREIDAIELEDNPRGTKQSSSKLATISARNGTNEDINEAGNSRADLTGSADWSSRAGSRRSGASLTFSEAEELAPVQQPGGPEVVPLPFQPPAESNDAPKSDAGSAKSGGTAFTALNPSALKQHNDRNPSRLPRIEDDRASSIAATADDEPDVDGDEITRKAIVRPSYRMKSTPAPEVNQAPSPRVGPRDGLFPDDEKSTRERSRTPSGRRTPQEAPEPAVEDEDDEELVRPQTSMADALPAETTEDAKRESSISSRRRSTGSDKREEDDEAEEASVVGSLTGHLPEAISKVAMAYRTNEWAKHIADADQPDEIEREPDSPGIQVDTAFREEAARPVDTRALSEVPTLSTPEAPRKQSKRESEKTYRQSSSSSSSRPAPSTQRQSSGSSATTPVYAFQRSSSQQSFTRQSSNGQPKKELVRSPSMPLDGPLIESPVEEGADHFVTPMTSSNNLLDQRNDRLKRKTTTTNFNALNVGLAEDSATASPSASASASSGGERAPSALALGRAPSALALDRAPSSLGGEDLTLAQRKALIQQQRQQQPTASPPPNERKTSSGARRSSNPISPQPLMSRTHSTSNPNLIYDSHQPQRGPTIDAQKQRNMYSAWRSSLAQPSGPNHNPHAANPGAAAAEEQARAQMLAQREQAAKERSKRQEKRMQRESMMDTAMRQGVLHGAHTDVLRKMQAKANESAK